MKLYHIVAGPIQTNTYLYADYDQVCVIVDPAADAKRIIDVIQNKELTPKAILLTHAHYDHIGAVAALCEKYPSLRVYMHKEDMVLAEGYMLGKLPEFLNKKDYAGFRVTDFVNDGDEIIVGGMEFKVIHTPGHTRGCCCYATGELLFTGDTLFRREVGRTDLFGGDYDTLLRSLKKLHDLEGDYTVLPGHEAFSKLSEERQYNHYIQEALNA